MTTLSAAAPPPPPPGLVTAEEFTTRYAHLRAELVKGIVKVYPVPYLKHGILCSTICRFVGNHVEAHDFGRVASNDSWIKTGSNPDTVRGADLCYFSYERLPKGDVPEGLLSVAPELVIEVRSPSDRWINMFVKVGEYLQADVRVVVILDPSSASASVYRADELQQIFHSGDELTLPDVLPGFAVPVSRLFT